MWPQKLLRWALPGDWKRERQEIVMPDGVLGGMGPRRSPPGRPGGGPVDLKYRAE